MNYIALARFLVLAIPFPLKTIDPQRMAVVDWNRTELNLRGFLNGIRYKDLCALFLLPTLSTIPFWVKFEIPFRKTPVKHHYLIIHSYHRFFSSEYFEHANFPHSWLCASNDCALMNLRNWMEVHNVLWAWWHEAYSIFYPSFDRIRADGHG